MGNRLRFRLRGISHVGTAVYDADASAYFAAAGIISDPYLSGINQFVIDLKTANLWNKLDRIWLFANQDAMAAITCLKSHSAASLVNSPAFTIGEGFAGNGSTSYINTGFIPTIHGIQFSQNSASLTFYSRTSGGSGRDIGAFATTGSHSAQLIANFGDNTSYLELNGPQASFASAANANASGLYMGVRTGANAVAIYKNGTSIASGSIASTGMPNRPIFIGAYNDGGANNPTGRQFALCSFGSGFDSSQAALFSTFVNALKTTIGF